MRSVEMLRSKLSTVKHAAATEAAAVDPSCAVCRCAASQFSRSVI